LNCPTDMVGALLGLFHTGEGVGSLIYVKGRGSTEQEPKGNPDCFRMNSVHELLWVAYGGAARSYGCKYNIPLSYPLDN